MSKTSRLRETLSSLRKLYLPYLPAIITLIGGVFVAIGLFFGQTQGSSPVFQWFRLVGAVVAAIGALWSAHNQIQSGAANKERDQKLIDVSEQLRGHLTGGDSFCYGYPFMGGGAEVFQWIFSHEGQYPLTDVSVRIFDLGKPLEQQGFVGRTLSFRAMFPGKAINSNAQDQRFKDRLLTPGGLFKVVGESRRRQRTSPAISFLGLSKKL
jgi:hypothetical protein